MANLTLRNVKGSPLTYTELDTNFVNINDELSTVTDQVSTLNTQNSTLSGDLTTTKNKVTNLETSTTTLSGQINTLNTQIATKQATLVSGTNIKTVNGANLLGSGNVDVGGSINGILKCNGLGSYSAVVSGTDVKTVAGVSILGSGDIPITKTTVGLSNVENTALSTWTGSQNINTLGAIISFKETKVALPANNIDLATGNLFTKTISAATTFTLSNIPAAGNVSTFIIDLTNGGSAVITWWSGIKWVAGTAPSLTAAGRDLVGFITHDGGTTWVGVLVAKDVR